MVKCANCGIEVDESTELCPNCGNNLKSDNASSKGVKCPNCGHKMDEGAVFCNECGYQLGASSNDSVKSVEKDNSQKDLNQNQVISDKSNLIQIIVSTIISFIFISLFAAILMIIGFEFYSFPIALIIGVLLFAAALDNKINAALMGGIVGFILALFESSIVGMVYGSFATAIYEFSTPNYISFLIIGIIVGILSNHFLHDKIRPIVDNLGISWL